jgi:hypothetical protein
MSENKSGIDKVLYRVEKITKDFAENLEPEEHTLACNMITQALQFRMVQSIGKSKSRVRREQGNLGVSGLSRT